MDGIISNGMDFKNIDKSMTFRSILIGIGVVILALVIFQTGQITGYRKARFAGNFGNNFERNFIGPKGGGMRVIFNDGVPSGHGAVGEILSITLPQFIVVGPDNIEKTVMVNASTTVRCFRDNVAIKDIKTGDFVVVLGNPNDSGQVEAKLIRIMPAPEENFKKIMPR